MTQARKALTYHEHMSVTWEDFTVKPGATYQYVQLANWIEQHVQAGRLKPGDRLPSQAELGALTGTSTELAGKAIRLLRDRGYVETSQRGSYVRLGISKTIATPNGPRNSPSRNPPHQEPDLGIARFPHTNATTNQNNPNAMTAPATTHP